MNAFIYLYTHYTAMIYFFLVLANVARNASLALSFLFVLGVIYAIIANWFASITPENYLTHIVL